MSQNVKNKKETVNMCKKPKKKTKTQQRTLKLHIFDYLLLLNLFFSHTVSKHCGIFYFMCICVRIFPFIGKQNRVIAAL